MLPYLQNLESLPASARKRQRRGGAQASTGSLQTMEVMQKKSDASSSVFVLTGGCRKFESLRFSGSFEEPEAANHQLVLTLTLTGAQIHVSQLHQLRLALNAVPARSDFPFLVFYVEMNWLRRCGHVTPLLLPLPPRGRRGVARGEVGSTDL